MLVAVVMGTTQNWARFARWNVARAGHRTTQELKHRITQILNLLQCYDLRGM